MQAPKPMQILLLPEELQLHSQILGLLSLSLPVQKRKYIKFHVVNHGNTKRDLQNIAEP